MTANRPTNGKDAFSQQIESLEHAIEEIVRDGGAEASALVEKSREVLAAARAMTEDLARTTSAELADGAATAWNRARDFAQYEVEVARDVVRRHPMASMGGVAAVSALTAMIVTLLLRDSGRRDRRW